MGIIWTNLVRANYSKPTAYKSRPSQLQKTQKKSQSIHWSGTKNNTQAFTRVAHMLVVFIVYFSALSESKTARLIASNDASIVKHGQCCRSLINSNKKQEGRVDSRNNSSSPWTSIVFKRWRAKEKAPMWSQKAYLDFSGIFHGLRSSSECPMTVCVGVAKNGCASPANKHWREATAPQEFRVLFRLMNREII